MPLNAGDAVRVQFRGSCFGQRVILDLAYIVNVGVPGPTQTPLAELVSRLSGGPAGFNVVTPYLACLPPEYTMDEIRAQKVFPVKESYYSFVPVGAMGSNANSATVSNDGAAVTRTTVLAGRKEVSTLKVGPAPDAVSVAGFLTPAYRTLLYAFGLTTIQIQILPVSSAQFTPIILAGNNIPDNRVLTGIRIGATSRVYVRRTVGRGE